MKDAVNAGTVMDAIREASPGISADLAADLTADLDDLDGERDGAIAVEGYTQEGAVRLSRIIENRLSERQVAPVREVLVNLLTHRRMPPAPGREIDADAPGEPEIQKAGFEMEEMIAVLKKYSQSPILDPSFRAEILAVHDKMREIFPEVPMGHALQGQGDFYRELGELKRKDPEEYRRMAAFARDIARITMDILHGYVWKHREGQAINEAHKELFRTAASRLDLIYRFSRPDETADFSMVRVTAANAEVFQKGAMAANSLSNRLGPYGKPMALIGIGLLVGAGVMYGVMKYSARNP